MELIQEQARIGWVRLSTLVFLRWIAIAGQTLAVAVAVFWLKLPLPIGYICLAIGASLVLNLVAMAVFPRNERFPGPMVAGSILFDVVQIAALLMLTGGLNNPFSMLMLAPLTIGAAVLSQRAYVLVVSVALAMIFAMVWVHLPLMAPDGTVVEPPWLVRLGLFLSLVIGVLFFGVSARRVSREYQMTYAALNATQVALEQEHKMAAIGSLAAAAAHELGTPLATIKLASSELAHDLADRPDLADDVALIRDQADRCRDILHGLGRAGTEQHIKSTLLQGLIEEALAPHENRGKAVDLRVLGQGSQPEVARRPEMIHALRNLLQNAVDHADQTVTVEMDWTATQIKLRIKDDGPGYPATVLANAGEPLGNSGKGMGMGLFIAMTLLRQVGARVRLANGSGARRGAIAEVTWPRD